MAVKRIGIEESVFNRLVEYKNKKTLLGKKSKYSFTDAIDDLSPDPQNPRYLMLSLFPYHPEIWDSQTSIEQPLTNFWSDLTDLIPADI